MVRGAGESSDDNYGIVEPRVGPSFQAEIKPFGAIQNTADTGRHDDVLLWHPDSAATEVVDVFLRQAELKIGADPRLVGSVPELALEALHQAAGDTQQASDTLSSLASRHAASLWSEEETAELEDAVAAHGTHLRRVHASLNLSTRSFPELVSQHGQAVEKWPHPTDREYNEGVGKGAAPLQKPSEKGWSGCSPKAPSYHALPPCHPIQILLLYFFRPPKSRPSAHRYFLTCYTREADDERVDGLRPRVRHRSRSRRQRRGWVVRFAVAQKCQRTRR